MQTLKKCQHFYKKCIYNQLLLYRTGVGTKIASIRYTRNPVYPNTRLYKTYCELFLRGAEILGPVCANSGIITESGIRVIDCNYKVSRIFVTKLKSAFQPRVSV